ncbi:hypothetical protein ADT71_15480 [Novosphingobium sp. ST904]|nr:hypothetical protein ADT71_15480 [Novosphingobium sp. ST904]
MSGDERLTDEEHALVTMIGEVWNAFLKLPEEHVRDRAEFCNKVHDLQYMILGRPARRAINHPAQQ